jgi:D-methionine transport system substrate-binding protein
MGNLVKKLAAVTISAVFLVLAACGSRQRRDGTSVLRVGVTPVPAGEVLEHLVPVLAKQGIVVKVISFSDYIQPDLALAAGELDANLYQNVPFMEQFNRDHGTHLFSVAQAYLPPMGLYAGRSKSIQSVHNGAVVSIPNDPVNSERGLLLLQSAGLVRLRAGLGGTSGPGDILDNPHHLQVKELEAAQLPRSLPDVDFAVINANFAMDAGLNPKQDALFRENPKSKYVNVLACDAGKESDLRLQALTRALQSDDIRQFLEKRYKGAVTPAF